MRQYCGVSFHAVEPVAHRRVHNIAGDAT
jgi:hypothetical protein